MSESFIHSFNRFIQTADSFRNESIGYPYEWATESIDSLNSFKYVDSFSNETPLCVARRHNSSAVAFIATIFGCEIEQNQSAFCLKYKSLNFNFLFIFYHSRHLYILSYFDCAVAHTHSLRLFKPHLARNKCIINRRLN